MQDEHESFESQCLTVREGRQRRVGGRVEQGVEDVSNPGLDVVK